MARRKRLSPPDPETLATIRDEATVTTPPTRDLLGATAPIARIAGEAAAAPSLEIARLREEAIGFRADAARLVEAEGNGRLVVDLPIRAVRRDYLSRDRIDGSQSEEADDALRNSILEHGQRMPIEVVRLPGESEEYGLVSGWRRLRIVSKLHEETGDARFATIRAVVRTGQSLAESFVGMVEENEIRLNLSFFERGRICALSARDGVFPDADAAVETLFRSASAAKRSKIRSFVLVHDALGDVLLFPETLSERMGLTIAKALKWEAGPMIREGLVAAQELKRIARPEDEHREIVRLCGAVTNRPSQGTSQTLRRSHDPARHRIEDLGNGIKIERRCYAGFTDLRIIGDGIDDERLEDLFDTLKAALRSSPR